MSTLTAQSLGINYQKKKSQGSAVSRQCIANDFPESWAFRGLPFFGVLLDCIWLSHFPLLLFFPLLVASGEQSIVAFSLLASLVFPTAEH